ncbi:hypothetical protein [Marisediminicola antarctica]|uniref:Large exoprotein n=1 Tax=Marisediminicola antarctica TaxID=674079 RepID=A0A7L5ALQ8_9MICO|nr:hypothetical protein [Marisediminicola antarctica]QHO69229.1 hypothetical protein BHD05_05775 [Marisediminicola antarctica]
MGLEGIGSSVVIALAAVLWLVYLIPTWFRRREYLSTERNAVRLQQTLRILAETAEVPESVRAEATARSVAAQQKLLRQEFERARATERARESAMSRAAAQTPATLAPAVASTLAPTSPAAKRLRRSRAATTALLALSLATVGLGFAPVAAGVSTTLIASGLLAATASVLLLRAMAAVARDRRRRAFTLIDRPASSRLVDFSLEQNASTPVSDPAWTPVPVPKPLYLSKPRTQSVASAAAIAETRTRLLAEAEKTERAARAAELSEKVIPIVRPAAAPESRFARMGIVDETPSAITNLDEALRRRRAV